MIIYLADLLIDDGHTHIYHHSYHIMKVRKHAHICAPAGHTSAQKSAKTGSVIWSPNYNVAKMGLKKGLVDANMTNYEKLDKYRCIQVIGDKFLT